MKKFSFFLFFILIILVCVSIIEHVSKKIRLDNDEILDNKQQNRIISGYYIFQNSPNFIYKAYNGKQTVNMKADSNGFLYAPTDTISNKIFKDTFQIFLSGGSALMGSGQVDIYNKIHKYPNELYHYDLSIAGRLKNELELLYPDKYFKVINTALYTRTFHESFLMYVTKLSNYKPDLIIQMDGFNDLNSFFEDDIYGSTEKSWLPYYLRTYYLSEEKYSSNFSALLSRIFNERQNDKLKYKVYHPGKATWKEYLEIKNSGLDKTASYLKIVQHYTTILNEDNVPFIFSIQPMLHASINKKLSKIEERFRTEINFFEEAKLDRFLEDDNFRKKDHILYREQMLYLNYCWSDFLSEKIRDVVVRKNGRFIDFNQEATVLDENFELYTDFCHLTKDGNKFIAHRLALEIQSMNLF